MMLHHLLLAHHNVAVQTFNALADGRTPEPHLKTFTILFLATGFDTVAPS